ncbi:TonB-dependent receptor [Fulvivirga sediminis]|uniref:TonB-dependent receptor n=1 Tax=Fulvivirga sediminis TaxID=2803949 RepID=A0A937K1W8_9BACT|nr:TonB-dependent receptor [Fulvivirga sediminis]MBL3657775.1 TonB-dependent receptor [Fulvivirga sediminis]
MKKLLTTFILSCTILTAAFAQKGFLRGKVTDAETGEPLIGATISKQGSTTGSVADFEGNYSLSLEPGNHTITVQFVSYQTKTIADVVIESGKVNKLDISLGSDVEELAEVVVTAQVIKDSEAAVLTLQRKSANVLDGVSAQTFRKTGDTNLSSAIGRVTGVAVQGGKYVYVRGLGDRYTRTTLNGLSIPGLDPERNDVQIDIFPTNVLENVIVYKTFSPDLTGDFTGGIVNVETKSFPEEKITSISLGMGYNPDMHFNKDFVTYEGGKTDFLGFDDGTRELPIDPQSTIPSEVMNDPKLESITRSFNPEMATKRQRSFMNTSFSFNHGNQIDKGKYQIGYGVVLNYQNNYEYYEDTRLSSLYFKDRDPGIQRLDLQEYKNGDLGRQNVLWSGLVTAAIKNANHQLSLNFLRTQNGITESADRIGQDVEETGQKVYEDILTYSQRSVTNGMLAGKHRFDKLLFEWSNSYTVSRVYDPDFRYTSIAEVPSPSGDGEVTYSIAGGQGGSVRRFYRDLNEDNENFKLDLTYDLAEKNKIKAGGMALYKWREFNVYNYLVQSTSSRIENDPSVLLEPDNIWTPETQQGSYLTGNYEAPNNYESRSQLFAGYLMNDITLFEDLRAIYGVRLEKANMFYTGQDRIGVNILDDAQTLDELNILPALNLVYSLNENTNLRGSYGRTLARPSFKEKSNAQILDPITGLYFSGNIDLEQTMIDNYDLRIENFFGNGEMVSLSGFYKKFDGHIELTRFEDPVNEYKPRNIGGSYVYGLELEFRKNLTFLQGLSTGANLSYTKSAVDMTEVVVSDAQGTTEYESRLAQAREGESVDKTRVMAGQAPYLINAFINYSDYKGLTSINLSYNVQGKSLAVVGVGQVPDVYSRSFNSLKLNVSRKLGNKKNSTVTLRVSNLLGDKQEQYFENYDNQEELFSRFAPGRTFTLKYAYTF